MAELSSDMQNWVKMLETLLSKGKSPPPSIAHTLPDLINQRENTAAAATTAPPLPAPQQLQRTQQQEQEIQSLLRRYPLIKDALKPLEQLPAPYNYAVQAMHQSSPWSSSQYQTNPVFPYQKENTPEYIQRDDTDQGQFYQSQYYKPEDNSPWLGFNTAENTAQPTQAVLQRPVEVPQYNNQWMQPAMSQYNSLPSAYYMQNYAPPHESAVMQKPAAQSPQKWPTPQPFQFINQKAPTAKTKPTKKHARVLEAKLKEKLKDSGNSKTPSKSLPAIRINPFLAASQTKDSRFHPWPFALKIKVIPPEGGNYIMRIKGPLDTLPGAHPKAEMAQERSEGVRQKPAISNSKYIKPVNRNYQVPPSSDQDSKQNPLVLLKVPRNHQNYIELTTQFPNDEIGNSTLGRPRDKILSMKLPFNVSLATVLKNIYENMFVNYLNKKPSEIQGHTNQAPTQQYVYRGAGQELPRSSSAGGSSTGTQQAAQATGRFNTQAGKAGQGSNANNSNIKSTNENGYQKYQTHSLNTQAKLLSGDVPKQMNTAYNQQHVESAEGARKQAGSQQLLKHPDHSNWNEIYRKLQSKIVIKPTQQYMAFQDASRKTKEDQYKELRMQQRAKGNEVIASPAFPDAIHLKVFPGKNGKLETVTKAIMASKYQQNSALMPAQTNAATSDNNLQNQASLQGKQAFKAQMILEKIPTNAKGTGEVTIASKKSPRNPNLVPIPIDQKTKLQNQFFFNLIKKQQKPAPSLPNAIGQTDKMLADAKYIDPKLNHQTHPFQYNIPKQPIMKGIQNAIPLKGDETGVGNSKNKLGGNQGSVAVTPVQKTPLDPSHKNLLPRKIEALTNLPRKPQPELKFGPIKIPYNYLKNPIEIGSRLRLVPVRMEQHSPQPAVNGEQQTELTRTAGLVTGKVNPISTGETSVEKAPTPLRIGYAKQIQIMRALQGTKGISSSASGANEKTNLPKVLPETKTDISPRMALQPAGRDSYSQMNLQGPKGSNSPLMLQGANRNINSQTGFAAANGFVSSPMIQGAKANTFSPMPLQVGTGNINNPRVIGYSQAATAKFMKDTKADNIVDLSASISPIRQPHSFSVASASATNPQTNAAPIFDRFHHNMNPVQPNSEKSKDNALKNNPANVQEGNPPQQQLNSQPQLAVSMPQSHNQVQQIQMQQNGQAQQSTSANKNTASNFALQPNNQINFQDKKQNSQASKGMGMQVAGEKAASNYEQVTFQQLNKQASAKTPNSQSQQSISTSSAHLRNEAKFQQLAKKEEEEKARIAQSSAMLSRFLKENSQNPADWDKRKSAIPQLGFLDSDIVSKSKIPAIQMMQLSDKEITEWRKHHLNNRLVKLKRKRNWAEKSLDKKSNIEQIIRSKRT